MDTSQQAMQVRDSGSKRRFRTVEEKRRIVEETLVPGVSVARVARAHGVNANQVFAWRRQYRQGLLESSSGRGAQLLAVGMVEAGRQAAGSHRSPAQRAPSGLIHLEFPKGQLRIAGRVDAEVLRVVLEKLLA